MTQEVIRKINPNQPIKYGGITFAQNGPSGVYLDSAILYNDVERFDNKLENAYKEYGIYWDDLRISSTSFMNGATAPQMTQYNGSLYLPSYAASATIDQAFTQVLTPHNWKLGTALLPHVHWSPNVGGGVYDNQGICWKLDYSMAKKDGIFGSPVTMSGVDTWTTGANGLTQYQHRIIRLMDQFDNTSIAMTGLNTADSLAVSFIMRIYRDNNHTADTFSQPAHLLEMDFHYQIDAPGSKQEFIK